MNGLLDCNYLQFARLVAEINALGLLNPCNGWTWLDELFESMDITIEQLDIILEAAENEFDNIKDSLFPPDEEDLVFFEVEEIYPDSSDQNSKKILNIRESSFAYPELSAVFLNLDFQEMVFKFIDHTVCIKRLGTGF